MHQNLVHENEQPRGRSQNQCHYCGWFAAWRDLERVQLPETSWSPAREVWAHAGARTLEQANTQHGNQEYCQSLKKPNLVRRARPRCPKCKHGGPQGHGGRICIAWVAHRYYEGIEYDTCGCNYGHKNNPVIDHA